MSELLRLNKYIAYTGLCSRRKAAELVKAGEIKLNGKVETNPAVFVQPEDIVEFEGKKLEVQEEYFYLLLNKPTGLITTMSDERGRKTVWDHVKEKCPFKLNPVGRLDRNTSGLLLMTNDGDLAHKLSHPSSNISKTYEVKLDKPFNEEGLKKIRKGLVLEDGPVEVDAVNWIVKGMNDEVSITLHLGKNRIVRRIFEHLGYHVVKLDRVNYAGLTKKNLPRSWSRFLSEKEVIFLKHFSK